MTGFVAWLVPLAGVWHVGVGMERCESCRDEKPAAGVPVPGTSAVEWQCPSCGVTNWTERTT